MMSRDLRLIFRLFWKRRVNAVVILLSLVTGFVCLNLLISFLTAERNTDSFHVNKDRVYQVFSNDPFSGQGTLAFIPGTMGDYLPAYPEVEKVCQIAAINGVALETSAGEFNDITVLSADSTFFNVFSFPVKGGARPHLLTPQSIVLTEDKATLLFGKADVEGYTVSLRTPDTTRLLVVSDVLKRAPENSHLIFDALVHPSVIGTVNGGGATYVLLSPGAGSSSLQSKVNADSRRPGLIGEGKMSYSFQPLTSSYFNADNRMPFMKTRSELFIRIGYIVCGLILFMASFNFINLLMLSWHTRRKEIGIKKTLGISLSNLFRFSVTETMVYLLIAYGLSLLFTEVMLPVFNAITDTNLSLSYLSDFKVISIIGLVLFLLAAVVVIVSVWKQWQIKAVSLMQPASAKMTFSRVLFSSQFVIAITFTICAVTIVQQMQFMEQASLGFNRSIIQVNFNGKSSTDMLPFKQKVLQIPGVRYASVSGGNPISGNQMVRYDLENDQYYTPYLFEGDADFINALHLQLLSGKVPNTAQEGKLVNETLVRQFDMKQPIGELIPGTKDRIAGVVQDFICVSMKQKIPPVIISFKEDATRLLIDYSDSNLASVLVPLQREWKNLYPDQLFMYRVIQQDLANRYREDNSFYKITVAFAGISIVISCFGLFALSWTVVQNRTKEMGIRKVLGATPVDILMLLTGTFAKRIALAFLIAAPVGYYLVGQWLNHFAYRIQFSTAILTIAAAIIGGIALLTIGLQTVRAALVNPVRELKSE